MSERVQMPLEERLIVALDVPDAQQAGRLVATLAPSAHFFKVGLELFLAAGFPVVQQILERGCKVMLDLKFYDVPNTVAAAVRQIADRGVSLATLHGDPAILRAAAGSAFGGNVHGRTGGLRLLAVTALTSMSQDDLTAMGFAGSVEDLVLARARAAQHAGLGGIVCSPQEVARVRRELGWGLRVVTPGVRLADHEPGSDDQKRIATPGAAIAAGADHVVMGRPIRQASDPLATVRQVLGEIEAALQGRG